MLDDAKRSAAWEEPGGRAKRGGSAGAQEPSERSMRMNLGCDLRLLLPKRVRRCSDLPVRQSGARGPSGYGCEWCGCCCAVWRRGAAAEQLRCVLVCWVMAMPLRVRVRSSQFPRRRWSACARVRDDAEEGAAWGPSLHDCASAKPSTVRDTGVPAENRGPEVEDTSKPNGRALIFKIIELRLYRTNSHPPRGARISALIRRGPDSVRVACAATSCLSTVVRARVQFRPRRPFERVRRESRLRLASDGQMRSHATIDHRQNRVAEQSRGEHRSPNGPTDALCRIRGESEHPCCDPQSARGVLPAKPPLCLGSDAESRTDHL